MGVVTVIGSEAKAPAETLVGAAALAPHAKGTAGGPFDILLGLAMSLGKLNQNLQAGAATGAATMNPALAGAQPGSGKAQRAMSLTAAFSMAQAGTAGLMARTTAPGANEEKSLAAQDPTALAWNMVPGVYAMAPQVAPANPAATTPSASANPMAPAAHAAVQAGPDAMTTPGTAPAATPDAKTWNVRDLALQLNAALGAATGKEPQPAGPATHLNSLPLSLSGMAQSEKMRAAGTNRLLNAVGATMAKVSPKGIQAAAPALVVPAQTPASGQVQDKLTATVLGVEKSLTADASVSTDEIKQLQAKEIIKNSDTLPADDGAKAADAARTKLAEWAAKPVADAVTGTRMPTLIEQVHQVADFLANRTEGVIRMSQNGMEANLKLYPPDMGNIRVALTVQNNRTVQAQFIVERPETAQLLQQHLQSFQDSMSRQGLVVDRVQITVQPAGSASEGGWRQSDMQQDQRRESPLFKQRENDARNKRDSQNEQSFDGS